MYAALCDSSSFKIFSTIPKTNFDSEVTFILSASALNLEQCKIVSFDKDLIRILSFGKDFILD